MFTIIESLEPILQALSPAFTQPSFGTHLEVFLGWVMCLGRRTEYGVFRTIRADRPVSRRERHPFDRFYNFFSRSAWTVGELARQVAVAVVVGLNPKGLLYLAPNGIIGLARSEWDFTVQREVVCPGRRRGLAVDYPSKECDVAPR
jgi:hypothetical protein